uniref:Uncharacterized protein n=1 Tax=Ciona savignyi TaxID=51511 RepID=H2YFR6_CIOSA
METIPTSLHPEKKRRIFSADDAGNAPCLFSVARLLSILCEPAAEDLASAISKIISLLRSSTSCSEEEEYYTYTSADVDWGNAKDVQQDEDDITTHICGHPLPLIPDTNASAETFSTVRKLVYSQSTFVISFMKCLAGNTSLLRGRRKSKSPRPTSF